MTIYLILILKLLELKISELKIAFWISKKKDSSMINSRLKSRFNQKYIHSHQMKQGIELK